MTGSPRRHQPLVPSTVPTSSSTPTNFPMSILKPSRTLAVTLLALGTLGTAACSDGAAPLAPSPAPSGSPSALLVRGDVSSYTVGDTTVSTFTLLPLTRPGAFQIGNGNKIQFPNGASSVCDLLTSSYGPTEWDRPCVPSALPVKITAKTWTDANGLSHADFQPAMRFVPSHQVVLSMRNRDGLISSRMRVDFCTDVGCINEAALDPSVATVLNGTTGTASRRVKHFSGYMVTVGLTDSDGGSEGPLPTGEGW